MIPLLRSLVLPAENNSLITLGITENTALTPATSHIATEVHHMKRNETTYLVTMKLFQKMLKNGLLTAEEYAVIDTKMRAKYRPKIGTLFTGNPLTYPR